MFDNVLDERLDTGYRDIAGNIIYVGSTLSDPSHERAFDVYPGVVYRDYTGKFSINYQAKKNKNGSCSRPLTKKSAAECLVIS